MQEVDFGNGEETAKIINDYVDNSTNHLIKEVVKPSSFDGTTSLMLINAVYFFGKWETQFKKSSTAPMKFNVEEDKVSNPSGMNLNSDFNQVKLPTKNGDIGVLEMPYKDSNFAMYLILPPNGTDIRDFDWTELDLTNVHTQMEKKQSSLKLPKFKIEYEKHLQKTFKDMNAGEAFTPKGMTCIIKKNFLPV